MQRVSGGGALDDAVADATAAPYWLATTDAPPARPVLADDLRSDLVVVGGGLTGLWTALQALEESPGRSVVLLEGGRIAQGASGRNGGFCSPSLTHGVSNGMAHWGSEMVLLERLARENAEGIRAAVSRYDIDCGQQAPGELRVATSPHELAGLREEADLLLRFGWSAQLLDGEAIRSEIASPTYVGGLWQPDGATLLDPARLCWGLAAAVERLGGRIHEHSPVMSLTGASDGVAMRTAGGQVRARGVVLATSAFAPLVRSIRRYVLPVYDYVLVTERLSAAQLASVGWRHRQGVSDSANQFHYYRLTEDDRILWGGYDAIYHFANGMGERFDQRPATFNLLSRQFFTTFPQLQGVRFTHRWGGAIDTCSRFSVMFGRALRGRAVYAVGFTGLGVGASRFAGRVAVDLLDGRDNERTRLSLVRSRPLPFPPEPLRWAVVNLTRRELARADRDHGRRGVWLRTLDRLGLGFGS